LANNIVDKVTISQLLVHSGVMLAIVKSQRLKKVSNLELWVFADLFLDGLILELWKHLLHQVLGEVSVFVLCIQVPNHDH